MPFSHEKLKVYQRTLPLNVKAGIWTGQWDGKHAICDQLSRAAESMLENIAMASAAYSSMKLIALDYAIGSGLECAGCLDLACIKRLMDAKAVWIEKQELSQIVRILVGLRKSWMGMRWVMREEPGEYETAGVEDDKARDKDLAGNALFGHETLDVYRVGLEVASAFGSSESVSRLPNPLFRRLDELLTSMILNIAEGNGRFSDADQVRFLGIAHESTVKLAARLDLCVTRDQLPHDTVVGWKALLERVSGMTLAMIESLYARDGRQELGRRVRQSSRQSSRQR